MTDTELIRISIKKQLNSYRDLSAEHRQLVEELERLEALMGSPSCPNRDGMPRGASGPSNPVESKAFKHMELEQRYRAQLEKLAAAQAAIEDLIEGLEPTERRLARFRYIDELAWEAVCEKMSYSWRQTHRIHGRMLNRLVAAELEKRTPLERQPGEPADKYADRVTQSLIEGKKTINAARASFGLPPIPHKGEAKQCD